MEKSAPSNISLEFLYFCTGVPNEAMLSKWDRKKTVKNIQIILVECKQAKFAFFWVVQIFTTYDVSRPNSQNQYNAHEISLTVFSIYLPSVVALYFSQSKYKISGNILQSIYLNGFILPTDYLHKIHKRGSVSSVHRNLQVAPEINIARITIRQIGWLIPIFASFVGMVECNDAAMNLSFWFTIQKIMDINKLYINVN